VRTRLIVAVAALMAASALVAAPGPASSRPASGPRTIDPATLTAVSLELPATAATSIISSDIAQGPAAGLGPAAALIEPGSAAVPKARATVRQPASPRGVVNKNAWRFDPDISWYGPGFFGSGTACGQTFTRTIMGVAHRSLPCGTLVTFRNPANGRQITVPVIDRGPYVAGRTWDMSRGLCAYLDHCFTGSIEWRWGGG
jgi:hypothetical protein